MEEKEQKILRLTEEQKEQEILKLIFKIKILEEKIKIMKEFWEE